VARDTAPTPFGYPDVPTAEAAGRRSAPSCLVPSLSVVCGRISLLKARVACARSWSRFSDNLSYMTHSTAVTVRVGAYMAGVDDALKLSGTIRSATPGRCHRRSGNRWRLRGSRKSSVQNLAPLAPLLASLGRWSRRPGKPQRSASLVRFAKDHEWALLVRTVHRRVVDNTDDEETRERCRQLVCALHPFPDSEGEPV
jgi:hypothetical protein